MRWESHWEMQRMVIGLCTMWLFTAGMGSFSKNINLTLLYSFLFEDFRVETYKFQPMQAFIIGGKSNDMISQTGLLLFTGKMKASWGWILFFSSMWADFVFSICSFSLLIIVFNFVSPASSKYECCCFRFPLKRLHKWLVTLH